MPHRKRFLNARSMELALKSKGRIMLKFRTMLCWKRSVKDGHRANNLVATALYSKPPKCQYFDAHNVFRCCSSQYLFTIKHYTASSNAPVLLVSSPNLLVWQLYPVDGIGQREIGLRRRTRLTCPPLLSRPAAIHRRRMLYLASHFCYLYLLADPLGREHTVWFVG